MRACKRWWSATVPISKRQPCPFSAITAIVHQLLVELSAKHLPFWTWKDSRLIDIVRGKIQRHERIGWLPSMLINVVIRTSYYLYPLVAAISLAVIRPRLDHSNRILCIQNKKRSDKAMSSDAITLFDIPTKPPQVCWSMNIWRSKAFPAKLWYWSGYLRPAARLLLNFKGLDYKTEWVSPRRLWHVGDTKRCSLSTRRSRNDWVNSE